MPIEIDCPECGGKGVTPKCTNCSRFRWTGFGGGKSVCSKGYKMDSDNCKDWKKTTAFISEHNKCPHCKDGKITVYTEADMQKAVEAYEEYIELLEAELHDSAGFLLAHGIKSLRVEAGKKARAKIQALKENKS